MTTTLDPTPSAPAKSELADVQNSPDRREIRIDKVGVKNIEYPIVVKDRAKGTQSTVGTIDMYVDLPAEFKGTHMSRFLEVLNAHEGSIGVEELPDILDAMRTRLNAETAHFKVTFPYFIEKFAPVTGARGVMPYVCGFDACAGTHNDFVVLVEVPVTTLCPCSKEISARGAHNQRGIVQAQGAVRGHALDRGADRLDRGVGELRSLPGAQAPGREVRDREGVRQPALRRGPVARGGGAAQARPAHPLVRGRGRELRVDPRPQRVRLHRAEGERRERRRPGRAAEVVDDGSGAIGIGRHARRCSTSCARFWSSAASATATSRSPPAPRAATTATPSSPCSRRAARR